MRLLFAGTPATALPALQALHRSGHTVAAVLTRPDAPTGRRRVLTPSPVADAARELGLRVLRPATITDPAFEQELRELDVDAVAVVAFGALIPRRLLDIPRHGWVNLHFSLLPAWRGAAPVQAAIRAGDAVTGASTFLIEEGLDTGPVYGTVTESIRPNDTAGELLSRLSISGADLLVATMDGIEAGTLTAVPQPTDGVSHAGKITVDDARIDWSLPAFAVDRNIRAMTPRPGAWTMSRWGRLGIGPVQVRREAEPLPHGVLRADKTEVLVGTATEPVALSTVQPPGKRAIPASDWARGARLEPGDTLGTDDGGRS